MFFFRENSTKITESFQYIEIYTNPERKLKPNERVLRDNNTLKQDLYDLGYLNREIFDYLLEKKFSIEWIERSSFTDIFTRFLDAKENDLAEAAREWFSMELSDIESECNKDVETGDKEKPYCKRTPEQKQTLRLKLFDEKFLTDKEYFEKYKYKKDVKDE